MRLMLFLLFAFQNIHVRAQTYLSSYTFVIPSDCRASAGVYTYKGKLVRTLWSNRKFKSGTYTERWDRKDDHGQLLTDNNYKIKIISNTIKYTWEGVIGNNSDSLTGSSKIRAFNRFNSMAIFGQFAYYSIGYSEGIPSTYKLDIRFPRNKINILDENTNNTDLQCDYVCTDGQLVYWTGFDPFNPGKSFIFATKCQDDSEYTFSFGKASSTIYGRKYKSVINLRHDDITGHPSGLAVQRHGKYLIVSHSDLNLLIVYDKTTGDSIHAIQMDAPREICFDGQDQLWVIKNQNEVSKYEIASDGSLGALKLSISNLSAPLALAVSPNNYKLMVIEGGSKQQIQVFDNHNGKAIKTLGSLGGYTKNPEVNDYKFYFSDSVTQLTKPFIAFQPDSAYWVGDVGNERVQKYNSSDVFIDRIMCLPHSYSIAVDQNNPTRVIGQYLEFEIDYTKSLQADNGSWQLKRNWRAFIRPPYYQNDGLRLFRQMTTFPGNRTFAFIDSIVGGIRYPVLVELPENRPMKYYGQVLQAFGQDIIESGGHLRRYSSSFNLGDSGYIIQNRFKGYVNERPAWEGDDTIARIPKINSNSPAHLGLSAPAVCQDSIHILFNPSKDHSGYHLGAIHRGSQSYQWVGSPSTFRTYTGDMPHDGVFDIGNKVEYAGGGVYAKDSTLFWNYHGEFWKNSQTNIWNHFHSSGLMLSQFGITTPDGEKISKEAFAQGAGNVFSSALVKVGDVIYIYHNDESVHGGLHRWRVEGLNSIKIQYAKIQNMPIGKRGLKGSYFKGTQIDLAQRTELRIDPTINQLSLPNTLQQHQAYTILHEGYLESDTSGQIEFKVQSNGKVRLWLNDSLVIQINTSGEQSTTIELTLGQLYPLRIESSDVEVKLFWTRMGGTFIVPQSVLIPEIGEGNTGMDLMYGLKAFSTPENNQYGWSFTPSVLNGQELKTRVKVAKDNAFDLYINNNIPSTSFLVQRQLKGALVCQNQWAISGDMNWGECTPEIRNGGLSVSVKDENGRTMAVIRYEILLLPEYQFPTSLRCNGEPILNQSFSNVSHYLSKNRKFRLTFNQSGVLFEYGDLVPLQVPYFDQAVDWQKPGSLNIEIDVRADDDIREISLSNLKIEGQHKIDILNLGRDTICQGESTVLLAGQVPEYSWSNQKKDNPITVNETGKYFLKFTSGNTCTYQSDTIRIVVDRNQAVIIRNGDQLSSLFETKKQTWLLNQQFISEKKTIQVTAKGIYNLITETYAGCIDSGSLRVDELNSEQIIKTTASVYPNPVHHSSKLHIHVSEPSQIEFYDENSQKLRTIEYEEGNTYADNLNPGVYFLKIISKTSVLMLKVIVL